jgi:hypothetical protein
VVRSSRRISRTRALPGAASSGRVDGFDVGFGIGSLPLAA